MSSLRLRRLCRPEILRSLDVACLEELLKPHVEFLALHGVTLPLACREAPLKYMALAQLLSSPPDDMPTELMDAFYYLDTLATPTTIEALKEVAAEMGISFNDWGLTPADAVLQLWTRSPALIARVHAEMSASRFRIFDHYYGDAQKQEIPSPLPIAALEADLQIAFEELGRTRYARVFTSAMGDDLWFYIAHGGPLKREGTVEKHGPSSICYRPEIFDSVVYSPENGELAVHARTVKEKELYRRLFGRHLMEDEAHFQPLGKYSLEPLAVYGKAALKCQDVAGIEWVRLSGIEVLWPQHAPRQERQKAVDLFADPLLLPRLPSLLRSPIVSASFCIKILGCRQPRTLQLRPPHCIRYVREADRELVERWLFKRGFAAPRKEGSNDGIETLLAVA